MNQTTHTVLLAAFAAFMVLFALKTRITVNFFDTENYTVVGYHADTGEAVVKVLKARDAADAGNTAMAVDKNLVVCAVFEGTQVPTAVTDSSSKPSVG